MGRKKLTAEERLNLISCEQISFDKLNKETGMLSGVVRHPAAPAIPPLKLAPLKVEKGIGSDIASEDEDEDEDEGEEEEFEEQPVPKNALSPHLSKVMRWGISPQ